MDIGNAGIFGDLLKGATVLNDILFVLLWPAVIWACYAIIRTVEDAKEREQEQRYNDVFWND